jgi:LysR family hydrogen peroxide-inducible transcriptional activator
VKLTDLGEAFLPRVRAVLRDLESARNDIVEKKTSITGLTSVGVIPTIAPYFLPSILATFSRKWPLARVTVLEEITPLLLDKLRAGSIDVAIVALPVHVRSQEFESFPVMTEKLFAVLPKRHELASRREVSLGELHGQPFLLLRDGHCFRETAVEACKRARLNPQIVFESGQFSSILSMVSAGLGVSIVPAMAREKRLGCRYVPLADGHAVRTIGVVMLNGKSPTRANEAFWAHLGAKS